MKKLVTVLLLISTVTIGIPFLIVKNFSQYKNTDENRNETISVYIKDEDKVTDMELNQYLKEVVCAEMPAEFEIEALKAQAIAARTYLVNRVNSYKNSGYPEEHKGADVCTDATHCKAWISEKKIREKWDKSKENEFWKKISDAVEETDKLIITYNDEPISAVFHSTSSGMTENAEDVWGGSLPYLVSVKSDGDFNSPKFKSERILTIEEFKSIAESDIQGVRWDNYLIGKINRSSAGGIISIDVGGILVDGTDFRMMFDLKSTNIQIEQNETHIKLDVTGYGHGVGMSQYGANHLALNGKKCEEILKTYYSGVEIVKYEAAL